jgi:hypothetical protein
MHRAHLSALPLLLRALSALAAATASVASARLVTVLPAADTNAVLHNPDLGWVLYENFPLNPDPKAVPQC